MLTNNAKNTENPQNCVGFGGLFRKVHFLEILENMEILEILENRQTAENEGESDHFLEMLETLGILEILEIPPAKTPPSAMTPLFRSRMRERAADCSVV